MILLIYVVYFWLLFYFVITETNEVDIHLFKAVKVALFSDIFYYHRLKSPTVFKCFQTACLNECQVHSYFVVQIPKTTFQATNNLPTTPSCAQKNNKLSPTNCQVNHEMPVIKWNRPNFTTPYFVQNPQLQKSERPSARLHTSGMPRDVFETRTYRKHRFCRGKSLGKRRGNRETVGDKFKLNGDNRFYPHHTDRLRKPQIGGCRRGGRYHCDGRTSQGLYCSFS